MIMQQNKAQINTVTVWLLCLCLLLCSAVSAKGQVIHLFLLAGQSNMDRMNPEESFTPAVTRAFSNQTVIVIKDAQGGQPVRRWYKKWKPARGTGPKADGVRYDKLIGKVKAATGLSKPTTITLVWMQGERDAKEKHHAVYAESLQGLVQQLRDDLNHTNINVVIGRLNDAKPWLADSQGK